MEFSSASCPGFSLGAFFFNYFFNIAIIDLFRFPDYLACSWGETFFFFLLLLDTTNVGYNFSQVLTGFHLLGLSHSVSLSLPDFIFTASPLNPAKDLTSLDICKRTSLFSTGSQTLGHPSIPTPPRRFVIVEIHSGKKDGKARCHPRAIDVCSRFCCPLELGSISRQSQGHVRNMSCLISVFYCKEGQPSDATWEQTMFSVSSWFISGLQWHRPQPQPTPQPLLPFCSLALLFVGLNWLAPNRQPLLQQLAAVEKIWALPWPLGATEPSRGSKPVGGYHGAPAWRQGRQIHSWNTLITIISH